MASSLSQDAFHTPDEWVHSVMWNFKVKTRSHPSAHSSEVSPLETQKWVRSVKDDTRAELGCFSFFLFFNNLIIRLMPKIERAWDIKYSS